VSLCKLGKQRRWTFNSIHRPLEEFLDCQKGLRGFACQNGGAIRGSSSSEFRQMTYDYNTFRGVLLDSAT